jgi:methylthioribulose-1-phosphate dehydratase
LNSKNNSNANLDKVASEIAEVGRFLASRGWSPATSSNYSVRLNNELQAITKTGINKYQMSSQDIMAIDSAGNVVSPLDARSSAETLIHTAIYKNRPEAQAILHTHWARNTRLSLKFLSEKKIEFSGYEMQKGLGKNRTHLATEIVPILPNAQDMVIFSREVEKLLHEFPHIHGFLIAGHGLYTWAPDLRTCQRHVETFEFLFECLTLELAGI